MVRGLNRVYLIGNLGHDPEVKSTAAGKRVAKFSLAVNVNREAPALWVNIVAWEKTADVVEQYLHKGDSVHIEGRLQCREWEGKNREKHKVWEVVAQNILMLGGRPHGQTEASGRDKQDEWPADQSSAATDYDDEVPF